MDAGRVQVAITYVDARGEESGTLIAGFTDVPANGGVQLDGIPQPSQPHVTNINIYRTAANGVEFKWVARVPVGVTSLLLGAQQRGRVLQSQFYANMPAGQCAAYYNGTLFVAVGNTLLWSVPNWYGQVDTTDNYITFGAPIDLVIAAGPKAGGGGVFVSAGRKTMFLPGPKPKDFRQVDVAYGAFRGSGAHVSGDMFEIQGLPSHELPVWVDKDGHFTIGLADGTTLRPMRGRYAMEVGEFAQTFVRRLRGVQQYVLAAQSPTVGSAAAFTDTADMVLIRRADRC